LTAKALIALVNESTCWKDADIASFLPVLQIGITRDFAPIWNADADLIFYVDRTARLRPDAWPVIIRDTSDVRGALGYHEKRSNGLPIGYCFAGDDLKYNEDPRTTLDHEIKEMLADPYCTAIRSAIYAGQRVLTLCETCDAVEEGSYLVNGQPLSNFVTPAFFDTDYPHAAGTRFDFCGQLSAPMTIAKGGYLSVQPLGSGEWQQVYGENVPERKKELPVGSRRARFALRENSNTSWIPSTAI
jgi:hypothetical protein